MIKLNDYMRRLGSGLRGAFILLLIAVTALSACSGGADDAPATTTPVRTQASWQGPPQPPITANGVVAAHDEMRLSFKVGGVIHRIAVQAGDRVRKGQLLADIDLTEIDAQVEQAKQVADKAARDLARGERLQKDQVITQEQLQDLRTQAAVAGAALQAASFNRSHAMIVAPVDGTVLAKLVEERELVPAGQPVLALGATNGGFVIKTALADRDMVALRLGDAVDASLDAFPGHTLAGKVREIAGAADPATGLFPVEVQLADPPAQLASGMVARLTLKPAVAGGTPLVYVPILAVVEGDRQKAYVYVIANGHAVRREVQVAFITNDSVALAGGLAAGTPVITEGALFLKDQEAVRLVGDAGA